MKKQKGFSLIELLIVVAIILIIAAIAIPNLLKSRMAANESSAVGSLRTLNTAEVTYSSTCPNVGFSATLSDLNAGGCAAGVGIIDSVLATGNKSGYQITYTTVASGVPATNTTYTFSAAPVTPGVTGTRYFFTNHTGVIRYGLNTVASAASSALQ